MAKLEAESAVDEAAQALELEAPETTAQEPVDVSAEDAVDELAKKPAAKAAEKRAKTPVSNTVAKPVVKPAVKPTVKPAAKRATSSTAKSKKVRKRSSDNIVLRVEGLEKHFGSTIAVEDVNFEVASGTVLGIVGPNGAGKTTTLSMITGLLRPDAGTVLISDLDVWADPAAAKRIIGVLPDRLRLFDRLTGSQLLYYCGILRELPADTVKERIGQLARAFNFEDALPRLVADYSAGMTKKIALAAALIHSPRVLVLDEPFESVDPVSANAIIEVLENYVEAGGTVVLSSHSMGLIERMCDSVAVIVEGKVLVSGTVDEVRGAGSLEDKFLELVGTKSAVEELEWLHDFSN
ncbi:MAG: ABC transporter ATP-binding protein [Microbacteriaceae bacterium]|nr:ABC transporter ATP-binding protein [Microbacteriaceae bacterium]